MEQSNFHCRPARAAGFPGQMSVNFKLATSNRDLKNCRASACVLISA